MERIDGVLDGIGERARSQRRDVHTSTPRAERR